MTDPKPKDHLWVPTPAEWQKMGCRCTYDAGWRYESINCPFHGIPPVDYRRERADEWASEGERDPREADDE